jgi:hypothetical protein
LPNKTNNRPATFGRAFLLAQVVKFLKQPAKPLRSHIQKGVFSVCRAPEAWFEG